MSKTTVAAGCGAATIGAAGVGAGVYVKYLNSDDFYDEFMDTKDSIYEEAWKKKFKDLKSETNSRSVTEDNLLKVKTEHKSKQDGDTSAIQALKDACQKIKDARDSSLLTSETRKDSFRGRL